jgi:hypothetical protein
MVIDVCLNENELRFLNSNRITFYGKLPEKVELKMHHSKTWDKLSKRIVITTMLHAPLPQEGGSALIDKDGFYLLDKNGINLIPNYGNKLFINFVEGDIIEIPREFFTYPGVVLYCEGQNPSEKPSFYISSNYLIMGVDKWCKI